MAKYLNLWEINIAAMPIDPAQRAAILGKLTEMTKKFVAGGKGRDWGIFPGSNAGYAMMEGTAAEALSSAMQFNPYVKSNIQQVLSIDEAAQVMQAMQPKK